eukprot:COSAG01_NODE_84_length_27672_cov_60.966344_26_plen_102_part_00
MCGTCAACVTDGPKWRYVALSRAWPIAAAGCWLGSTVLSISDFHILLYSVQYSFWQAAEGSASSSSRIQVTTEFGYGWLAGSHGVRPGWNAAITPGSSPDS